MKQHSSHIPLEQAISLIRAHTNRLLSVDMPTGELCGQVLAEDVIAQLDQPPFPRSPLDGYALRGADSAGADRSHPISLNVTGKVCAGEWMERTVQPGEAVRIMTGAPIPPGADAVIRQEDTDLGIERVLLYQSVKPWQNYCYQGEDFRRGTLLLKAGTVLDAEAVAILACNGIAQVKAVPKPQIAILSTGDELVMPGRPLSPGKIYNSNLYLLQTRLREMGVPCQGRPIGDNAEAVCEAIEQAIGQADAIITTGGVSVGERDVLNEVLPMLGAEMIFDGLQMKPGSPAKYALLNGVPLLALSGNPFAAAATMELLGRPMLGALMGSEAFSCMSVSATLGGAFPKPSRQRRFVRARWENGIVTPAQTHSSGQLFSMLGCNCLIDIPAGTPPLEPGCQVQILLL